jgi:hypothetical protein
VLRSGVVSLEADIERQVERPLNLIEDGSGNRREAFIVRAAYQGLMKCTIRAQVADVCRTISRRLVERREDT